MDALAGLLTGIGGLTAIWAVLRFAAPRIGKFAGRMLKLRDDLEADTDRVVVNLRAEIGDYQRRIVALSGDLDTAQKKVALLTEQLDDCETFVKRYLHEARPS